MSEIASMPAGSLSTFGDNEILLKSTKDDPAKIRMESPGPGRSLGCYSFGRDGKEKVLIQGKLSEDGLRGEFGIWLYDESRPGTEDDKMGNPLFYVTPSGLGNPAAPVIDRMTSQDGRFVTVQQGDGNFVTYDLQKGALGEPSAAVWASGAQV